MKKFLISILALGLYGCTAAQLTETGNIAGDVITDVQAGAATYLDAQTALGAAQQVMGGHGISLGNVLTYAQAESSAANTSGVITAANTLIKDITSQINAGTSTPTIVAQLTTAQTAITPSTGQ